MCFDNQKPANFIRHTGRVNVDPWRHLHIPDSDKYNLQRKSGHLDIQNTIALVTGSRLRRLEYKEIASGGRSQG